METHILRHPPLANPRFLHSFRVFGRIRLSKELMKGVGWMITLFGYSLKGFKSMLGTDGYVMRGTIMKGQNPIAEFFDEGRGGMVMYTPLVSRDEFAMEQFAVAGAYQKLGFKQVSADNVVVTPFDWLISDIANLMDAAKSAKRRKYKNPSVYVYTRDDSLGRSFALCIGDGGLCPIKTRARDKLIGEFPANKVAVWA